MFIYSITVTFDRICNIKNYLNFTRLRLQYRFYNNKFQNNSQLTAYVATNRVLSNI